MSDTLDIMAHVMRTQHKLILKQDARMDIIEKALIKDSGTVKVKDY